ncbi:hypothetical protein [Fulvivirga sedimenti]|uniref:Multidrug transporter n=1 Tax=Fulvivirga sedimenti TaxID=2879465 RepID=A0A9X1HWK3_9BACT|nr:hypothetical protein [Fulvivirga sedimenti]MCA6079245.1 hypothetical protein [Fulvivirga sedimenti]
MKMIKNYLLILAAAFLVTLSSCGDDDSGPVVNPEVPDGIISDQDDVDLVVGNLRGTITGDITLAASEAWLLTGPLVVAADGKLTIEAGTTILAQSGGTNVYIAVERNAQIDIQGTSAAPVTITSDAASPTAGDWGGLLIMGNGEITGGGTAVTEVVDFLYGNGPNSDNTESSGSISYLILEYTGARINGEKEFNGLTLYGVGSGTTISNVAIYYGDDDAIEFFGGAAVVDNLLVVNATDDMFDWTQGWVGSGTNWYGIREAGYTTVSSDPRGIEGDGSLDGLSPEEVPQSDPTITNITIVHNAAVEMSDMIKVRRGSGAAITNALVMLGEGATASDFVDLADGAGDAASGTNINVSGTGIDDTDIKLGANETTVTVPENANTGVANPETVFGWTGYQF